MSLWILIFKLCLALGTSWVLFLFLHRRGNRQANQLVAILLLSLVILLGRQFVDKEEFGRVGDLVYLLSQCAIFLVGPSLYHYIQCLTGRERDPRLWIAFLPAGITLALMSVVYYYWEMIDQVNDASWLKWLLFLFVSLQMAHLLIYVVRSKRLESEIKGQKRSDTLTTIHARWLSRLVWIVVAFSVLILGMYALILSGGYYRINNTADTIFFVLISAIILVMVISFWNQPEIASGIYRSGEKYRTTKLSDIERQALHERINHLLSVDQVFLRKEMTLDQFAKLADSSTHMISRFINEEFQLHFHHFINKFRIEHAAKRIEQGALDVMSMDGLAFECGFNSKTTFNRAFKKWKKCTPTTYAQALTN